MPAPDTHWKKSLGAGIAVAVFVGLAVYNSEWREWWSLLSVPAGAVVAVIVQIHNPNYWLRYWAGALLWSGILAVVGPDFGLNWTVPGLGPVYVRSESLLAGVVLLVLGAFVLYLENRRMNGTSGAVQSRSITGPIAGIAGVQTTGAYASVAAYGGTVIHNHAPSPEISPATTDDPEAGSATSDIFLSYRFRLRQDVEPLVAALERAGVRVWRDVEKLRSGDAITDELRKALAQTRALAVFASADYFDSEICAWELASAWSAAARTAESAGRVLLLQPADVENLDHVRVGPLADSLAFAIPADASRLDDVAQKIAGHLRSVGPSPLGSQSTFVSPKAFPHPRAGSNRFVGRTADLWKLHGMLLRSRQVGITGQVGRDVAQVRGLGGIGKTLLAIEYARRFDNAWPGGIFWINADALSDIANRSVFLASLADLVKVTATKDINETARLVEKAIETLTSEQPYLWILDNVPPGTTQQAIELRMPPGEKGALLLTTRWLALNSLGERLDLKLLDAASSYTLLTQAHIPRNKNEVASARDIITLVDCHPLALDVLRALVAQKASLTSTPYRAWADQLADTSGDHLDDAANALAEELPTNCARAISLVLSRSLDCCSELAIDVLQLATGLAPETIPGGLVTAVLNRCDGVKASKVEAALGELSSHALVRLIPDQGVDVHALVRRVVMHTRTTPGRLEELTEAARTELAKELGDLSDVREHERVRPLVAHAFICADATTRGAAGVNHQLGIYFYARGDYRNAHECNERAHVVRERILGPEHPDTLSTLQNLAGTLKAQGDFNDARELNERVLAARQRILGSEHPDTLGTLQNLAATLHAQGDFNGARERFERALAVRERILGPEHPDTLGTLQNLAVTLKAQGDFNGARELNERALAAREHILGPEHPDTLHTLQNLAGTLYAQGDFNGAREIDERTLAVFERILGPEHPDTLGTLQNLAATLKALGDQRGARKFYERALAGYERILGPEHPDTLRTMQNLAGALNAQGPQRSPRTLRTGPLRV